jgi:4'-phosphopantetheinyl transferase
VVEIREINEQIRIGLLDLKAFSVLNTITAKRDLERAGTQYLLKQVLKTEDFALNYTSENKPFLNNSTEHISITHSHDKLAIILNKKEPTGIDIELIRDKVKNIQHKFLNESEQHFANNDIDKLLTFWAAKEALYKVYGLKEVDFRLHLFIEDFEGAELNGRIEIKDLEKKYLLISETIEDYKMVYILNEI